MNLARLLRARADAGRPVRVGLIGAGKFGSMFLAQLRTTPGLHLLGIADLSVPRARAALERTGWDADAAVATSFDEALRTGRTMLTQDAGALIAAGGLDVVVEATGNPAAGANHALLAIAHGRHVVMVTVEADVLVGPLLAARARAAGVVYSMGSGDQPALVCEMVDWARACGFNVVCAGKGTKYLPSFHHSTPDTIWSLYGLTPEQAAEGGMNAQMFNSFADGTKSAIEMAAIANAANLRAPSDGLLFPPCGVDDLATILRPREAGGVLEHSGTVETVSSLERDGRPVFRDLRWGVYVVFEADPSPRGDYARRCFKEYGVVTDSSGRYTALYRPYHLIGLELGISVASAALRGEPTGATEFFNADVVAVAKRPLRAGEVLDGEGGYTVWGKLLPAASSLARGALPIGLAHHAALRRDIAEGEVIGWSDVAVEDSAILRLRREMEQTFSNVETGAMV
ncbi:NAD(P)H-dependent oxidoreductase [Ancylobacter amanitiformis]|uniref:Homoserine dehydrogenase-like protein n=1 Tax=Ancylobacter amanitiformis TaxID=217069 RepID=A0ABU0LU38_9HYPH|nr:SAF domain-containing protein [Ancylobacter amanitiformis]MDQ0512232.1 putative homoserine dehydrogenase-like protein [Ancylobacter amanitiformis]